MEAVCVDPGGIICVPSIFLAVTLAFLAMTPFAAARLLVLRMRVHSGRSSESNGRSIFAISAVDPGRVQPV